MGSNIFVRCIPLPRAVRAVTLPNDDCTFDIYVNADLPEELQQKALDHELAHIRKDHFYNEDPVWINEKEADTVGPMVAVSKDGDQEITEEIIEEVQSFLDFLAQKKQLRG